MIPPSILERLGSNLYRIPSHPLCIIKNLIYQSFPGFHRFENLEPRVSTWENFDSLLIPQDHPSRSKSDTYYFDESTVLRTHTSAHQNKLLKSGEAKFLVTGDVYRKDDIDATHYPVFHQMEGVKLTDAPAEDLKKTLSGLIESLFPGSSYKFVDSYFPFTHPSWEVEVHWQGKDLEVLGCGVIHPDVLRHAGIENKTGWAFGLGLERLAMVLFEIPDIRLFWSKDSRFIDQFEAGKISKFQPFSKHPPVYKDIAFWLDPKLASLKTELCQIVRDIAGLVIEDVSLLDEFIHPKTGLKSQCYRMTFRSWERTLTNDEINLLNTQIRTAVQELLPVELR